MMPMIGESLTELDNCLVEESSAFESSTCLIAYEYWQGLADEDSAGLPRVRDLNLMDLYKIADRIIVKQIIDGGREFRNRFWGSRVAEAFGLDATNKETNDYYEERDRDQILALLRAVIAAPRPVRVTGQSTFFAHRNFNLFEAAYLPFYDDDGNPDRLVDVFDFKTTGER